MTLATTLALAVIPSLLLVRYFHVHEAYPEPPAIIWSTFILGALIIVPVLVVTLPLFYLVPMPASPFLAGTLFAFLYAAIPEEFFKLVVLSRYSMRRRDFDEPMDGIVYGAVVAQGFAALENVMYSVSVGPWVTIARGVTAVPAHAAMGIIMGYYLGRARFEPSRRRELANRGFALATLLHGLYDAPILSLNFMQDEAGEIRAEYQGTVGWLILATAFVLVFMVVWAVRLHRRARRDQAEFRVPPPMPHTPITAPPALARGPLPTRAFGWTLCVAGALLALVGGVMCFGGVWTMVNAGSDLAILAVMFVTVFLLGVVPLLVGLWLFSTGVCKLNAARRAALSSR